MLIKNSVILLRTVLWDTLEEFIPGFAKMFLTKNARGLLILRKNGQAAILNCG